jgi:hypothetical protein
MDFGDEAEVGLFEEDEHFTRSASGAGLVFSKIHNFRHLHHGTAFDSSFQQLSPAFPW